MRNETLEKSPLDTSTKALMKSIIRGYISPRQRLLNGSLDRLCQERDTVMYLITHCEMNEPQSKHAKYIAECYQRIIKLHQVFCNEHKTGYHLSGLKVWGELCKVVYSVDPQDTNLVHLMVLNYAKTNQPIEVADRKAYDTIMRWCEQIGLDKEQLAYIDNNLKYKKVSIPMDKQSPKVETLYNNLNELFQHRNFDEVVRMTHSARTNCVTMLAIAAKLSTAEADLVVNAITTDEDRHLSLEDKKREDVFKVLREMGYKNAKLQVVATHLGWTLPKDDEYLLCELELSLMDYARKVPDIQAITLTNGSYTNCSIILMRLLNITKEVSFAVLDAFLGHIRSNVQVSEEQRNQITDIFIKIGCDKPKVNQLLLNLGWIKPEGPDLAQKLNEVNNRYLIGEINRSEILTISEIGYRVALGVPVKVDSETREAMRVCLQVLFDKADYHAKLSKLIPIEEFVAVLKDHTETLTPEERKFQTIKFIREFITKANPCLDAGTFVKLVGNVFDGIKINPEDYQTMHYYQCVDICMKSTECLSELGKYIDLTKLHQAVELVAKPIDKEETNMKETTGRISDFELYANARAAVEQFGESHYMTGTDALEEIRAVYTDILALPVLTGIVGNYAKLFVIYEQALLALGDIYSGRMTATEYVTKVTTKVREVKEGQCEGPNLLDQLQGLINSSRLRMIPVADQWLTNGITDSELEDLMSPNADLGMRMLVVERANLLGKQLVRREYDQSSGVIGGFTNSPTTHCFPGRGYNQNEIHLNGGYGQTPSPMVISDRGHTKGVICRVLPENEIPKSLADMNIDQMIDVIQHQARNFSRHQPATQPVVQPVAQPMTYPAVRSACCCGRHNPVKVTTFNIDLNERDENPLKTIQYLHEDFSKPGVFGGLSIGKDMFIKIGEETIDSLAALPLPVLPHCYTLERAKEVLNNFTNCNNTTVNKLVEILAAIFINAPVNVSVPAIKQHYLENNGTVKRLEGIERTHAEKLLANMLTNKFGKANW